MPLPQFLVRILTRMLTQYLTQKLVNSPHFLRAFDKLYAHSHTLPRKLDEALSRRLDGLLKDGVPPADKAGRVANEAGESAGWDWGQARRRFHESSRPRGQSHDRPHQSAGSTQPGSARHSGADASGDGPARSSKPSIEDELRALQERLRQDKRSSDSGSGRP